MKNFSGFKRFLALTLCIVMLCAFMPAQASAWSYQGSGNAYASGGLWSWLGDLWDWLFGGGDEPSDPDDSLEFNLVEDSTTVSSGTYLRASTYAAESSTDTTVLKYFPVTLFNYGDSYNSAMHQIEAEANQSLTQWNGIYFGGNGHGADVTGSDSYTYGSTTITASYADYNKWTGNVSGTGSGGNRTYSGLVESNLDANKNIIFTKSEAGIFTLDTTNKDVYTNVELPFVYANNKYTFDADTYGVYFHVDGTQGSTAAQSNGRLYFSDTPQSHDFSAQDYRTKGWFPFNDSKTVTKESGKYNSADYFFGMSATIPFTMTANGRLKANDNDSTAITFNFSGDDDVWVFIDGVLVLDIGGIHNCLNGSIDFAANTWTITKPSTNGGGALGDCNGSSLSGALFNDGDTVGILGVDRATFAANDSHELTIFYLERGAGSSNCKIEFNLPLKDYVSVTKRATHSKTGAGEVSQLTPQEQAMVNAADFGFTLYKNDSPVANTNYNLIDANGQYVETRSTDANGHFTLKNGQTAKFIGEIATDGSSYYVVEDEKSGYVAPAYTYTATAAGGAEQVAASESWKSMTVNAKGSDEAEDNVQFVCTNYLSANLTNPSLFPEPDKIVIDYGLPVIIPVLANDTWKGESIELKSVTNGTYGTANINADGTITYTLTQRLDAVDVLTYTAQVTGAGSSTEPKTGTIYIIPATSMYYEENFGAKDEQLSSLITYSSGTSSSGTTWAGWEPETTGAPNACQEPGVVGTVGDSPYGSDVAYTDDAADSNGTVMSTDTTNYYAYFRYEFIGTGTAFFARLGEDTGYLRIVLENQTDTGWEVDRTIYRDTIVLNDAGTFYNVPVYDVSDLHFGRHRLTVTVVKQGYPTGTEYGAGQYFYLDGVRVYNPIYDPANPPASTANNYNDYVIAAAAYAADGESNNTTVTVREKIIVENEGQQTGFISFTDTKGEINMSEYQSIGPKNELYLDSSTSQTITFYLDATTWNPNDGQIYLGIKAPRGSGAVRIGSTTLNIGHAADCYYDISNMGVLTTATVNGTAKQVYTFTITATKTETGSNCIISLTRLRVTGIPGFVIIPSPNVEVSELGLAIANAESYLGGNYTEESLAALQAAITQAQAVNNNSDATAEQISAAIEAINAAIEGLVEA